MRADPRFPPLADADWPDTVADMATGFAGTLDVYRTMAHHPALLRSWAPLRDHVVNRTALGPDASEFVILRSGHRLGSAYEWDQHILRARSRGLSDARIRSAAGPCAEMEPLDAILARAVDELFDDKALSDGTIDAVERFLGKEAVFDLIATVGFYSVLGYMLNSFGTPLDANVREALDRAPLDMKSEIPGTA